MDDEDAGIYARESAYLERYVQIGVASGRVIRLSLPDEPADDAAGEHPLLDRIEAYLGGEEDDFADVQVALTVPTDQRKVLEALRDVPYGTSLTAAALARMTPGLDDDDDADLEVVRAALRENPAPILIPAHRISDCSGAVPPAVEQRLRSLEGL